MKLDKHVVDMFTELTKPADDVKMEKTCYGTISVVDGTRYVKLDGSDLLVPAASTVKTSHGDRVTVLMKNHSLTVTGNLTAPATDGEGGSSGEAGTAATIEVGTVTTGEAGSSAMVTNVGTTSAAIFDFVIPRGDKGEKGDTGTWDGTIPDHEHTVSDITDFPTSLPANGGNAETVGGYSSDHILKHVTRLTSTDCNDITESGWYSFNGCSGHAPGSNSTMASGTYFILLNIPITAPGYFVQVATFIRGAVNYLGKTYIRHCNNGVWTEWGNIADGGNATMLDGYGKSLFFKWIADKNANHDCNDCTESGWYFFNGCKDHSPVNNGAMGMGGYFFLLTYRYNDSYIAQTAMYVHGTATYLGKTYTRYCDEGVWSNWINITDGGNADTVDGLHVSDITLSFVNKYKPLVVSVAPTSNSVILGWLPVDGATKYAVARYDATTKRYTTYSREITNTNYTVTGLSSDTTYQFLVQAYVNNKWSTFTTADHIIANTLPDYEARIAALEGAAT